MHIQPLEFITYNPTLYWGHNGYATQFIFDVSVSANEKGFGFKMEKKQRPYAKTWLTTAEDMADLNSIIEMGFSFGAFEDDKMIGWAICEYREWNNTLYIDNILVAENYRHKGIGKQLIETVKEKAAAHGCRLIELETQNTNVPAIEFYLKQQFKITGINMKLYDGFNAKETAIFMSYDTRA